MPMAITAAMPPSFHQMGITFRFFFFLFKEASIDFQTFSVGTSENSENFSWNNLSKFFLLILLYV